MHMTHKERQFQALVNALSGDMYRYAYWLCGDRSVAEDLVQETFMRAWKSLDSLRDEKAAKSWLITILRRENARRFERLRPVVVGIEVADPSVEANLWPEQDVERHLVQQAILQLDEKYREPLILQMIGGFSCEEIAELLGLGKGAVMTRLFRAKRQLGDLLRDDETRISFGKT